MWWPSLFSVLHDLWRFVFGSEIAPKLPTEPTEPPVRFGVSGVTPPSSELQVIKLEPNVRYEKDHLATKEIRSFLTAETSIPVLSVDLTTYEWLAYIFAVSKRPLPWNTLSLSPIGFWHQSLKGMVNVTIALTPKTQSLMEWQDEFQHGHVGYVTKVTPEEKITIQELGTTLRGVLSEVTLSLAEWRELRPVFISVA